MSELAESRPKPKIVIIGAGPGGLCMAIRLKQSGFDDFVLLERAEGLLVRPDHIKSIAVVERSTLHHVTDRSAVTDIVERIGIQNL